jgi:hypothetical protein
MEPEERDAGAMNEIVEGQYWRATRNPYPLKGFPKMSVAWDLDEVYEIIGVIDMSEVGHPVHNIIAFKKPGDMQPMAGWEIGEDSFRLGFELVPHGSSNASIN